MGAMRRVDGVYENLLPLLAERLNELHGTGHGVRYWRILLGPWLHFYVSIVYDGYCHLAAALEKYPACTTRLLSSDSFVTPQDTADFHRCLRKDSYHLQLYTRILGFLGKSFPSSELRGLDIQALFPPGSGLKIKIKSLVARIYGFLYARFFRSIVLRYAYFPRRAELELMVASWGRVLPIIGEPVKPVTVDKNGALRERLHGFAPHANEFEACLLALLPLDIPRCFVEGFHATRREAAKVYPQRVKAIFSSNAWYTDEPFKFWAAESAEGGSLLLVAQHGGTYGSLSVMPSEDHELAIADRYYTWGWERTGGMAKIVPMPPCIMTGRKAMGASNLKRGILWVPTQYERYQLQFPYLPTFAKDYVDTQRRFANALSKPSMEEIRIRHKPVDYGWALAQRLKDDFPDLQADPHEVPFADSLEACRLYVCDHLSTTFIEALYVNKPTILFWSEKINPLREDARPYYDLLRQAGILFDSPEAAAHAVDEVYHDVETWWNANARREAVSKFCSRYAMQVPDAVGMWAREFRSIAG